MGLGHAHEDMDKTEAGSFRNKQVKRRGVGVGASPGDRNIGCKCGTKQCSDVEPPESAGGRERDQRESSESGVCLTALASVVDRGTDQQAKRRARARHRKIRSSEGIIPDVQVASEIPPTRSEERELVGRFRQKNKRSVASGGIRRKRPDEKEPPELTESEDEPEEAQGKEEFDSDSDDGAFISFSDCVKKAKSRKDNMPTNDPKTGTVYADDVATVKPQMPIF